MWLHPNILPNGVGCCFWILQALVAAEGTKKKIKFRKSLTTVKQELLEERYLQRTLPPFLKQSQAAVRLTTWHHHSRQRGPAACACSRPFVCAQLCCPLRLRCHISVFVQPTVRRETLGKHPFPTVCVYSPNTPCTETTSHAHFLVSHLPAGSQLYDERLEANEQIGLISTLILSVRAVHDDGNFSFPPSMQRCSAAFASCTSNSIVPGPALTWPVWLLCACAGCRAPPFRGPERRRLGSDVGTSPMFPVECGGHEHVRSRLLVSAALLCEEGALVRGQPERRL